MNNIQDLFKQLGDAHKHSREHAEEMQAEAEKASWEFLNWMQQSCPKTLGYLAPWISSVWVSPKYKMLVTRRDDRGTLLWQFCLSKAYATALEQFFKDPGKIVLALTSEDKINKFGSDNRSLRSVINLYLQEAA
jgi:hypothetical protein